MGQYKAENAIQVRPGDPGRLIVRLPYSAERVAKIRTIEGRRWDPAAKRWTVPDKPEMVERLRALFEGEAVEDLTQEPAPSELPAAGGSILERVRAAIKAKHYSPRTGDTYIGWISRFLARHPGRTPEELGEAEIESFLSSLACEEHVSASTQNQALNAVLFMYGQVLRRKIGSLDRVIRAKRPARLPVVLTRDEVRKILGSMHGVPRMMAMLLYGAGLRLMECCSLRAQRSHPHAAVTPNLGLSGRTQREISMVKWETDPRRPPNSVRRSPIRSPDR